QRHQGIGVRPFAGDVRGLRRQADGCEMALDPRSFGWRQKPPARRVCKCERHADRHCLAMQQTLRVSGRRFERMAEGVAEVKQRAFAAFALVVRHCDRLGAATRCDRMLAGRAAGENVAPVGFQPGEEAGVVDEAVFDDLGVAGTEFPYGKRVEQRRVGDDQDGLVESANLILSVSRVDAGLTADRGVDLRQQRGRHLHDRKTAAYDRCGKSRAVAHQAAAGRHPRVTALEGGGEQLLAHVFEQVPALRCSPRLHDDAGPALAILLALALCGVWGIVVERIAVRPFVRRGSNAWLMATVALGIILENVTLFLFGKEPRNYPSLLADNPLFEVGDITVSPLQVIIPAVGLLAAIALHVVARQTRIGKSLLAVAQNPDAARLMGIDVSRAIALAYAVSTVFAGIAGILIAPLFNVSSDMGTLFGIKAFAVAIVGGITSASGVVLAGLLYGIVEALVTTLLGSTYTQIITFAFVIAALALLPNGLLGQAGVKKV